MDDLVIYPKTSRLYLYAAGLAFLLVLSAVIMFNLERIMFWELRIATMILAFVGCTLSGYGMMYFYMRAKQKPLILKAGGDGLHFDVSVLHRGIVDWANVQGYDVVRHAGRNLLLVHLKDPFVLIDAHSGLNRRLFKSNLKRFRTPVVIPAVLLDGDVVEIAKMVAAFGKSVSS